MLRGLIVAAGALMAAAGLGMLGAGDGGGIAVLACGALILIGTLYERVRYKRLAKRAPGPGWQRTSERFIDEETGKPVTVWIEPTSGERAYVED